MLSTALRFLEATQCQVSSRSPYATSRRCYQALRGALRASTRVPAVLIHATLLRTVEAASQIIRAGWQVAADRSFDYPSLRREKEAAASYPTLQHDLKHEYPDVPGRPKTLLKVGDRISTPSLTPLLPDNVRRRYEMLATSSDTQIKDAYCKHETAKRLGIGYGTLHKHLIKPGLIRTVRVGNRVLISRTEIERFLGAAE